MNPGRNGVVERDTTRSMLDIAGAPYIKCMSSFDIYTRIRSRHSFSIVTHHSSQSLIGLIRIPTIQLLHNLRRHHVLHWVGGVQAVEPEVLIDRVRAVGVEGIRLRSAVRVCRTVTGSVLVQCRRGERGWVGEHRREDGVGVELEDGSIRIRSGKAVGHRS